MFPFHIHIGSDILTSDAARVHALWCGVCVCMCVCVRVCVVCVCVAFVFVLVSVLMQLLENGQGSGYELCRPHLFGAILQVRALPGRCYFFPRATLMGQVGPDPPSR